MGWFTTSKVETLAVSREDRKKCWENRDVYFGCLDRAGVLEPGKEGNACPTEKSRYEASCAKSWIEYFNKRRILAEQQKDLLAQCKTQAQTANQR
ncbi:Cytochrome oxidase c subunit VIb domain containing protein [Tylopilus felleus]